MTSITAKKLFSNEKVLSNVRIEINTEGKISAIERNLNLAAYDFECLAPAFFDTHINGGEQYYFTQSNSIEAIEDIANSSAQYGAAYTLPCLITSSQENILKGINVIKDYMRDFPDGGVPGMHLEGPFLNLKKRGAHLAKYVRKPTNKEISEILDAGAEVIKIWTIAPENFSDEQIKMIQKAGVTIAAGHSNATYKESRRAFDLGIKLVTHLYNAMSPFHHRDPGLIGTVLENKEVWAPIIPDGIHCDYGAARLAYQSKPDRLFLISDALFLSRKKTKFQWEEFDAVLANGQYTNSEGNLAGSAISMSEAVQNAVNEIGIPLNIALAMASNRPAEAIGLADEIGSIAIGYPAKFVSFQEDKINFEPLFFPK